jgi:hypothetical protein
LIFVATNARAVSNPSRIGVPGVVRGVARATAERLLALLLDDDDDDDDDDGRDATRRRAFSAALRGAACARASDGERACMNRTRAAASEAGGGLARGLQKKWMDGWTDGSAVRYGWL